MGVAEDMCAPCAQAPDGRDPMLELTEASAASEAELAEIKFAKMYVDGTDQGVPDYTLIRESWYVNRKRRKFDEDDLMVCMCDEDQVRAERSARFSSLCSPPTPQALAARCTRDLGAAGSRRCA